ncbi:hypothetical protein E2C01_084349 [Portunus trituberculatus]|uniref:Uncharacterized protein n=1 Tax=Portunus trituberculatus TaxID=210409 RepID=A0A5B7JAH9_PORTR|nr:hypothetical protein [Portunus trituberculatus]
MGVSGGKEPRRSQMKEQVEGEVPGW